MPQKIAAIEISLPVDKISIASLRVAAMCIAANYIVKIVYVVWHLHAYWFPSLLLIGALAFGVTGFVAWLIPVGTVRSSCQISTDQQPKAEH